VLVVVQPEADGQSRIYGTEKELEFIKNQAGSLVDVRVTSLVKSDATVKSVQEGMKAASSVHFACHGVQHAEKPIESALLVARSERLALSGIINMKLGSKDLAFLSACQTSMGDEKLPDEAVHLTAGMLLAGYRGVIGTMWTISDDHAPEVADDVYKHIFQNRQPGDGLAPKAAEAVHIAVKNLRERGAPCKSWVPFVHFGI
jgi:CHAT domain-containing protein